MPSLRVGCLVRNGIEVEEVVNDMVVFDIGDSRGYVAAVGSRIGRSER
jgi:hypothetical protein